MTNEYDTTPGRGDTSAPGVSLPRTSAAKLRPRRRKVYGQTALVRFRKELSRLRHQAVAGALLALILVPLFSIAVLQADMPVMAFDGWVAAKSLRPSGWFTWSDVWFLVAYFAMVMMARRHGAGIVIQAQALAWLVVLIASFGMVIYLAPKLTPGDLPRGTYILAQCISWYAGPLAAIGLYDLTRGGQWWRAPMFSGLCLVFVQTTLAFPISYAGTGVPWGMWWMTDIVIKLMFVGVFLLLYRFWRKRLKPLAHLAG